MYQRKYIQDLGIDFKDTPQGFSLNEKKAKEYAEQRKVYGFDARNTYSLDLTIKLYLYENLCMYNEVNKIDTSYHKYQFKGEEITLQDCIDRMLESLKLDITTPLICEARNGDSEEAIKAQEKMNEWLELIPICLRDLWW